MIFHQNLPWKTKQVSNWSKQFFFRVNHNEVIKVNNNVKIIAYNNYSFYIGSQPLLWGPKLLAKHSSRDPLKIELINIFKANICIIIQNLRSLMAVSYS